MGVAGGRVRTGVLGGFGVAGVDDEVTGVALAVSGVLAMFGVLAVFGVMAGIGADVGLIGVQGRYDSFLVLAISAQLLDLFGCFVSSDISSVLGC